MCNQVSADKLVSKVLTDYGEESREHKEEPTFVQVTLEEASKVASYGVTAGDTTLGDERIRWTLLTESFTEIRYTSSDSPDAWWPLK
jgi:hypothetical protein